MNIKDIMNKVTTFGTGQLEQNLDQDFDRAGYITNGWLRSLYILLFKITTYLFAFELGFLGFTRQLDSIDIFSFFKKGKFIIEFVVIVIIAIVIQVLKQKVLRELQDKKQRKSLSLFLDCLRIVGYTLAYRFIKRAIIGNTKNMQLQYSGYILLAMLILFFLRKLLFWGLFISNNTEESLKIWQKKELKKKAQKDIDGKIKQINALMKNLQKIKKEVEQEEQKQNISLDKQHKKHKQN